MPANCYLNLFGIDFLVGEYEDAKHLLEQGCLMVAPAAPALACINKDPQYYEALKGSDFAIPDSGLMVLLLRLFRGVKLSKLSGLKFLKKFLEEDELKRSQCLLLIDPTQSDKEFNYSYLISKNIMIDETDHYIAPMYRDKDIQDPALLEIVESKRPKYILINLGGGIQERLGLYLTKHLSYSPGIICTGAAIAFFTGKQAAIPTIMDKLYMGWLMRCLHDPKRFIPRYLKGFLLIPLLLKDTK